jgi:hypothetical protein
VPIFFAFVRLNALQAAVKHSHNDGVSGINKLAGADERIAGKGGNNVCTLCGLLYVVKEFDDSGSRCRGPVGEMEYYLGWNTGWD